MSARADRLASRVRERELDALLVTNVVNVRYLTGFTGTNAACVVGDGVRRFLTDFRYVEQAKQEVDGFELERGRQDLLKELAGSLSGKVGFDDSHLTVRAHERLRAAADGRFELVSAGGLVEELRQVKEPGEMCAIREAARLADEVLEYLRDRGFAGRTEREVALDLEREMRDRGADDPSFPTIVAAADNGALPHAQPRKEPIPEGTLVVVDLGCVLDGYCSDCTRTFATGRLAGEARDVYELVLGVQEAAVGEVRAGVGCRELDAHARALIEAEGHGEHFGHGLGHGVGLEVHEGPRLSPTAGEDETLAAGTVVTVEPGVYLPGAFGVRIEDLVAVTDDGCEVLSRFPKSLTTVGA
jgi:Xaa-Pro aminopeptidase